MAGRQSASGWTPLRVRAFRALWIASLVSNVGGWMHLVAAQWLMTSLTDDAALVALLSSAAALPTFLLALPAGALADVLDRRRLIVVTQAWQLVVAGALGAITIAGGASPGLLLLATSLLGVGAVLGIPAFTAIVPDVVGRADLPAAISLNSITATLSQAVGPALGGLLVASLGAGAVFALNAVSFVGVVLAVVSWHAKPRAATLPAEHLITAMRVGARYVRSAPPLQGVLARCVAFVLGYAGLPALLALFARRELDAGAGVYGLLLGALGVGGVLGALLLTRARDRLGADGVLTAATLLFATATAAIALLDDLAATLGLLVVAGVAGVGGMASLNIAAQSVLPDWVRGRGLAVLQLTFQGTFALGAAVWGTLAGATSIPDAMLAAATAMAATALLGLRVGLSRAEHVDVSLAAHLEPYDPVQVTSGADPVRITVDYRVTERDRDRLLALTRPLRALRHREGATAWTLTADLSDLDRHTESFTVASWDEHLRSAQRLTADDRRLLDQLADLHQGPEPPRTHAARLLRPPTRKAAMTIIAPDPVS